MTPRRNQPDGPEDELDLDGAERAPEGSDAPDVLDALDAGAAETARDARSDDPVAALEQAYDELKEKYARALADHENARKRQIREVADARQYAITEFARELLDPVDSMERALAGVGKDRDKDPVVAGVRMVIEQLKKALKKHGVEPIDALGRPFDPNLHNAIAEELTDTVLPGTVTTELQTGYRIGDRLLRPSMVKVAKAPAAQGKTASDPRN